MPYSLAMAQQPPSPSLTVWSLTQFSTIPGRVGPGAAVGTVVLGVVPCDEEMVAVGVVEPVGSRAVELAPMQTARRSSSPRPSNMPVSQLGPIQGFQARSWLTEMPASVAMDSQGTTITVS